MSRYTMCPVCGHRMRKVGSDEYVCDWCDDADDEDDGEGLSVWDAADIWASNGKDEDYMFGYSYDELENAL